MLCLKKKKTWTLDPLDYRGEGPSGLRSVQKPVSLMVWGCEPVTMELTLCTSGKAPQMPKKYVSAAGLLQMFRLILKEEGRLNSGKHGTFATFCRHVAATKFKMSNHFS